MFKISSSELIEIAKTLQKASFAINTLERNSSNSIVFQETKKEIHDLLDKLNSRYDLKNFKEWKTKKL